MTSKIPILKKENIDSGNKKKSILSLCLEKYSSVENEFTGAYDIPDSYRIKPFESLHEILKTPAMPSIVKKNYMIASLPMFSNEENRRLLRLLYMTKEKEFPVKKILMAYKDHKRPGYAENFYIALANDDDNKRPDIDTYLIASSRQSAGTYQIHIITAAGKPALKEILSDIKQTAGAELTKEISKFVGKKEKSHEPHQII